MMIRSAFRWVPLVSLALLLALCGLLLSPSLRVVHAQSAPQFNRLPLRGAGAFDTQFNLNAAGPNSINSYLATYLTVLVYPDFLDQLSGSPLRQNDTYVKSLHTNPAAFYSEFRKYTAHLFSKPTYTWIYSDQGGYNPEAMVISTANAVFVVFRGTDRVGAAKTKAGYDWAEWVFSDFYAVHDTPDLPTLAGQVHKGFWDSLKARPKVIRQGQQGPGPSQCHPSSRAESSVRECVVSEIRAGGGQSKKVFILGHSLGAAHAQIFAGYLAGHRTSGNQSDAIAPQAVYAVAAPHPGNDAFRDRLNALIGKSRLQRFDFVNDPITMLPPYLLGPYQYGRAGTRTYYDDIKTVKVSVPERVPAVGEPFVTNFVGGVLAGGVVGGGAAVFSDFCFHYPQWYLNAAWSGVPKQSRAHLPVPLPVPNVGGPGGVYGGCVNPLTVARGERSEAGRAADAAAAAARAAQEAAAAAAKAAEEVVYNAGQLFANLVANPVADGTYYLRLLEGRKYLDISGSCRGQNGCKVQLWDIGQSTANNRFKIKKEIGGYTLRNGAGDNTDFLEVDADDLFDEGGRIQMWEANLPFGGHNANQLWHFYQVPKRPGLFVIRNVATGKVMDAVKGCVKQNGCAVRQQSAKNNDPTQVWILQRAN
jgi:hypothetical protein